MYPDAACEPALYLDPWHEPYDSRLRALVRRQRHIAYVYERPESSTFRYRVFNMIEALGAAPELDVSASWFTQDDLNGDLGFVDRADVIVLCRVRYDHRIGRLLARVAARGTRSIFDIDDLVFDTDYVQLVTQALDKVGMDDDDWNSWVAYIGRLGMTLRNCDAVMTSTAPLADHVRSYAPDHPTTVMPNFLNRRQVEISESLLTRKREGGYRREAPTIIGYFSGSPTHNRDLQIAAPALAEVMKRHPDVVVRIVGYIEIGGELAAFGDRVEVIGVQDFVNLQRFIAEVELNIVPLQGNAFTDCKSELKYFEAAAVGVVTIGSPTAALARVIRDGVNGYLAAPHEWEAKIGDVIETIAERPKAYEEMAERAAADALSRYGWLSQARQIESAVFG